MLALLLLPHTSMKICGWQTYLPTRIMASSLPVEDLPADWLMADPAAVDWRVPDHIVAVLEVKAEQGHQSQALMELCLQMPLYSH